MTSSRPHVRGLGDGADSTAFAWAPKRLLPESPLQPMDQLLAVFATLAGHGVTCDHIVYAHNVPRPLFDGLPGDDEHDWTDERGRHYCKRIRFGDRVTVTLYTMEPPAAGAGA